MEKCPISKFLTLPILLACLLAPSPTAAQQAHPREFWHQIAANHYAPPAAEQVFPLAQELSTYLSSSDPELRDDLAYSILDSWIVRQKRLSHDELVTLLRAWQGSLRRGIGETTTDTIFGRSFSALCLASMAERDLTDPFLTEPQYRSLLTDALAYLRDEQDLRGFDPQRGWIHATAHTADLLAALARNRLFTTQDQADALAAIARRLATAGSVFAYGEQDRLSSVAATIVARNDFDLTAWKAWVVAIDAQDQTVWKKSPPDPKALARFENDSYFLTATAAQISQRDPTPAAIDAQKTVLALLRTR